MRDVLCDRFLFCERMLSTQGYERPGNGPEVIGGSAIAIVSQPRPQVRPAFTTSLLLLPLTHSTKQTPYAFALHSLPFPTSVISCARLRRVINPFDAFLSRLLASGPSSQIIHKHASPADLAQHRCGTGVSEKERNHDQGSTRCPAECLVRHFRYHRGGHV